MAIVLMATVPQASESGVGAGGGPAGTRAATDAGIGPRLQASGARLLRVWEGPGAPRERTAPLLVLRDPPELHAVSALLAHEGLRLQAAIPIVPLVSTGDQAADLDAIERALPIEFPGALLRAGLAVSVDPGMARLGLLFCRECGGWGTHNVPCPPR